MLWYKGWLETRLKLLFILGIIGLFLYATHLDIPNARTSFILFQVTSFGQMMALTICAMLAGAGINTQPALQATKGLHGSTLFTLSLPVSRLRLIAVRAGIGWLETVCAIALYYSAMWFYSPLLRAKVAPFDLVKYAVTLIVCASVIYCLSVLLAAFLDEIWRVYSTMFGAGLLVWLSSHFSLPTSIDFVRAAGKNSPLFTHSMPWSAMVFSLGLSVALFYAALKVAQAREY
jgi:hypothetical protein